MTNTHFPRLPANTMPTFSPVRHRENVLALLGGFSSLMKEELPSNAVIGGHGTWAVSAVSYCGDHMVGGRKSLIP